MKIILAILFLTFVISSTSNYPDKSFTINTVNNTAVELTFASEKFGWIEIDLRKYNISTTNNLIINFYSSKGYLMEEHTPISERSLIEETNPGNTFTYRNCNYTTKFGNYTLSCLRILNINEVDDFKFTISSKIPFIFTPRSYNNKKWTKRRVASFFIQSPSDLIFSEDLNDSKFQYYRIKGIILSVSWFIFNFIGVVIISRFKQWKYASIFHGIFCGGVTLITLVLGIIAIIKLPQGTNPVIYNVHHIIGFLTIILSVIQSIIGLFVLLKVRSITLKTGWIHKFKKIHGSLGILTVSLAYTQIIIGYKILFESLIAISIVAAVLYYTTIVFIIISKGSQEKKKITLVRELNEAKFNEDLTVYTYEKLLELRSNPNFKYVLLDNFIVDITNYIEHHPGGQIHLLESLNYDISRFLDQTASINSKFLPHNHLYLTYQMIYSKLIKGIYVDNHGLIVKNNYNQNSNISIQSFIDTSIDHYCEFNSSREIAKSTREFKFRLAIKNTGKLFSRFVPGYTWIGRHYAVSSVKKNITRYYSVSLCLNDLILKKHIQLLDNIKLFQEGKPIHPVAINQSELYNEDIEFYVKKYNVNGLSQYLFENQEVDDILIKGPIGIGLNLDPKVLSGVHILFGAGTGIFCFVDFVAFTLRYMCYLIAEKNAHLSSNKILDEEKEFSKVRTDFKLIYFSTFADHESSVFNEVCLKMIDLENEFKLGVFEFHSRISNQNTGKWDKKFLGDKLGNERNIKKVFLCGPTSFLDVMKESINASGIVTKDKIHLI